MNRQWIIQTKGDPLGTVNRFIRQLWQFAGLQSLILPSSQKNELCIVGEPSQLSEFNPFQPIMIMNIAGRIPQILKKHPEKKFGVILRPCELRALKEVAERESINQDQLMTICVDCLGTFPEDEFEWRIARKGSEGSLVGEALKFAPQGGIAAYRYRAACQMCIFPGARSADINIGVLGVPVRQYLLVDGKGKFLDQMGMEPAPGAISDQRELMLSKLVERHAQTRERVMQGLAEVLPTTIDSLLDQFESCGSCKSCMQACPICSLTELSSSKDGRYDRQEVVEWLVDCAGCGMCEQACPRHMPLSIIFTHVKKNLEEAKMI